MHSPSSPVLSFPPTAWFWVTSTVVFCFFTVTQLITVPPQQQTVEWSIKDFETMCACPKESNLLLPLLLYSLFFLSSHLFAASSSSSSFLPHFCISHSSFWCCWFPERWASKKQGVMMWHVLSVTSYSCQLMTISKKENLWPLTKRHWLSFSLCLSLYRRKE